MATITAKTWVRVPVPSRSGWSILIHPDRKHFTLDTGERQLTFATRAGRQLSSAMLEATRRVQDGEE